MEYLRQPIICVLGHVDHGKTSLLDYIRNSKIIDKEAGGITQHIGATEVSKDYLKNIVKKFIPKDKLKIPGLLFIDTPGHKAFTTLRKRGGAICDIGILIVDMNEGFKPQTIEAIEILKSQKTPFIIAANKIDRVMNFNNFKDMGIIENIETQTKEVKYKIDELIYKIVGKVSEYGINSERFDRITDFTNTIGIVPISAKFGIGIVELISTLVGLTQKYMENKLLVKTEIGSGVIIEEKEYTGLGKTFDLILYDGLIKKNDKILSINDKGEVISSYVKSILKPNELKEIRDLSTKFKCLDEVHSACGIKICAPNLVNVKAGMPVLTLRKNTPDEILESYYEKIQKNDISHSIELDEIGILIKADTLGGLEALYLILKEHKLNIRKAQVGVITKNDLIDSSIDKENDIKNLVILNFSQKVSDEISFLAKEHNVKIISNDIIYKIVEDFIEFRKNCENLEKEKFTQEIEHPFKFKILENCIFRKKNPAIIGIECIYGIVKPGKTIINENGEVLGTIKTLEDKGKKLEKISKGEDCAISIPNLSIGKLVDENSFVFSQIRENNFETLKENKDKLSDEEKKCMNEILKIKRKINGNWGK